MIDRRQSLHYRSVLRGCDTGVFLVMKTYLFLLTISHSERTLGKKHQLYK
jgi:hypothetical protein